MKVIHVVAYSLALALVILLIYTIHNQVREYHLQDDPVLHTLKELLKPVHPIVDNIKLYKGDKSYTINKERIFLCLKDEHGEYYPINTLIYVLTHELSHMINTYDVGHTDKFHEIFEQLLDRAVKLGIYNPSIPVPNNYCTYND